MKKFLLFVSLITGVGLYATAQGRKDAVIMPAPHATHIGTIMGDTIVVATGSTFSFTVDTPEGQGLVSTATNVNDILQEIRSADGSKQQYKVEDHGGAARTEGALRTGDRLIVTRHDSKTKNYYIAVRPMALGGKLEITQSNVMLNTSNDLVLYFTAGQRSPDATVKIYMPAGVITTMDNTTVNVIGRGDVKLRELPTQSIGRTGNRYSYTKVGEAAIGKTTSGGPVLILAHLDLRPANGADLRIVIHGVKFTRPGKYQFRAVYSTSKPEGLTSAGTGAEMATIMAVNAISDFRRVVPTGPYKNSSANFTSADFVWTAPVETKVQLMQSADGGKTWNASHASIDAANSKATIQGLIPNKLYKFRLTTTGNGRKAFSNTASLYTGKIDIKSFGIDAAENIDNTDGINKAIDSIYRLGGGTLLFSKGVYSVRTVHLKSNVDLYIDQDAVIKALKGTDAPEATWFCDRKYRSGLSPTDAGPYEDPDNYMTKQDVGHHYFRNGMFFAEREDNIRIIGNGLITGNGNLVTGDRVMNNAPDNRGDKMFVFKLCTNIEIGGIYRDDDLWYDSTKNEPYYIDRNGGKDLNTGNMLQIDRAGHFALLATGTDGLYVHDTYFGKNNTGSARDIYDFMACNDVTVTNIYSKLSSDDIIKPGSDCSLGFTRPAHHYKVRNVIGDTNCNLFQIGSETADDIQDLHVDNIYVLGANKAGFSISTNDGAYIKDVHLNCGHTGPLRSRSKMFRTYTPFFISISNRGRILGAEVGKYSFTDNGEKHNELLVKNVNIGQVENIILNGIDVAEVYAGSGFNSKDTRWKAYDGTQRRATPIVAGYSLPEPNQVEGGLDFKLPNGKHTGYIKNIVFNDVNFLVKGGNPISDTSAAPQELGVGQYNAANLKLEPSYGLWARHVQELAVNSCNFNYEQRDSRYAIFLDDVSGAKFSAIKMVRPADNNYIIGLRNSSGIAIENTLYFADEWGKKPTQLPKFVHQSGNAAVAAQR